MGRRTSVYLSGFDEERLARSGLTLTEVLREGFAAIELKADLGKVELKIGGSRRAAQKQSVPAAPPSPDIPYKDPVTPAEREAFRATAKPLRRKTAASPCNHPPARVHKGLCGACGSSVK